MITNAYKGTLYLGHTDNLAQRMDQHRHGLLPGFSKKYGLRHLVWYRAFETRDAAFKCERQMKEWKRDWKLKRINDMNPDWIDLSTVPVWPLPDPTLFSELYADCLTHRLDPDLRRDERRYIKSQ